MSRSSWSTMPMSWTSSRLVRSGRMRTSGIPRRNWIVAAMDRSTRRTIAEMLDGINRVDLPAERPHHIQAGDPEG